jgi:two-component sensor histidine kinase
MRDCTSVDGARKEASLAHSPIGGHLPCGDLLLAEQLHRFNNELASAVSILSRAAARSHSDEVKSTLAVVAERLLACAEVNRALQIPANSVEIDAAAYIRGLCETISRSKLADKRIRLAFVDQPLRMNAVRCWRLGLAVSELITNAVRHAFGEAGGLIRVELVTSGPLVECRVSDNGRAAMPTRPGRGLAIVESLVRTLEGSVEYVMGERGSAVVLAFARAENAMPSRPATIDISAVALH